MSVRAIQGPIGFRLVSVGLLLGLAGCAVGSWRVTAENDLFPAGRSDRNYTSGVSIAYSPDETNTLEVGQKFYSPEDLTARHRVDGDRPNAGQLWVGHSVHRVKPCPDGGALREQTGLRVGLVGAGSLASETQRFVHKYISFSQDPKGWASQIEDEVTLGVHYERRRRLFDFGRGSWKGDATALARADVGTDITRFRVGGILRFGFNLATGSSPAGLAPTQFGPRPERPRALPRMMSGSASGDLSFGAPSGGVASASEPTSALRVYISLGADAHYTAYNVFIDNHLFGPGTDLSLEPLGYDLSASVTSEWKGYRFGYQQILRSAEFVGDVEHKVGSFFVGWEFGGS